MVDIQKAESYVRGISYETYSQDDKLIDATMFRLIQIAENIKNLSDEIKIQHPDIPWEDIVGFRNRIVHDYGHTDYAIVYHVLTIDLPQVEKALSAELG